MMIPSIRAAQMINESQHLERSFLWAREQHAEEVKAGARKLIRQILIFNAIDDFEDMIYLE
jgi:hypothetical protein